MRKMAGIVPAVLTFNLLLGCSHVLAVTDVDYDWRSVTMQGGGYATSIVIHPLDSSLVYMRTDVAGFYRWDPTNARWIQLTDQLITDDPASDFWLATESVAVDPTDTNKVFISAGGWGTNQPLILRSADKGNTWSSWVAPFTINGNGDGRWGGERLAVDPNNPNVIYYGTRAAGIYKSTDGAASFAQLASFSPRGDGNYGVEWVAIDSGAGTTSVGGLTVSSLVYAGVNGGTDQGIYRSTDGGQTWGRISTLWSNRGKVAPDGTFWLGAGGDGLFKMARGGSGLTDVTPLSGNNYGPIGIDPRNSSHLVVSTSNGHGDRFFRSTDAGASWSPLNMSFVNNNPGTTGGNTSAISSIAISPTDSGQVWYSDWYNAWRTEDVGASPAVFTTRSEGYEALVILAMCSPSAGVPLFSGGADHSIFRHSTITGTPTVIGVAGVWEITGIDFCEADPNYVVAVGGKGWEGSEGGGGGTSTNNGASFTDWANIGTSTVGLVAVGATKQSNGHPYIVWLPKGQAPKPSSDGGQTWGRSRGGPTAAYNDFFAAHQVLVSDRVNGSTFYILNRGSAQLYRSTDGGARWSNVFTFNSGAYDVSIDSVPGVEGALWVALDGDGLWRVTNSGTSAVKIPNVQWAKHVSVGKPQTAGGTPPVYIHGGIDNVRGIFRSDDNGASWVRIYNQLAEKKGVYKEMKMLEADKQIYGRLYVATGGRGVWVGDVSGGTTPPPPSAPTNLTATAGDTQVSLSWSASSGADSYNVKRSTTSGSGYATVASPTSTTYTNTNLTNGITYYYVVSVVNSVGESANSNEASATPQVSSSTINIAGASSAPTIDGNVDSVWSSATAFDIDNVGGSINNASDLSASWKGLWDSTHLYVLAEITDDTKRNDSTDPWQDDSVELFVDGNNDKAGSYDSNDRQIVCGWGDAAPVEGGGRSITGVTFAKADPSSNVYRIEVKVPWNALGVTASSGKNVGIDVHVNDDDRNPADREGKKMWWDTADTAWQNPSVFGTAKLQ